MLARALLGKVMVTNIEGVLTSGLISETEAYAGVTDRASHAYGRRHTIRTAPMYKSGGTAYIYLIYGIYSLFNVVTAPEGTPHAVLIRGLEPLEGTDTMMQRRSATNLKGLCNGPGKLARAMGIHYSDSGLSLLGNRIWIEDRGFQVSDENIVTGPRIGVGYAGKDALLPYRFQLIET